MANRAQLYKYKGDRCSSCSMSVPDMLNRYGTVERMFEFHHVKPSSKDKNYKNIIRQQLSEKQIDEVDKCTLLCSQCHSILHAQNNKSTLEISMTVDGRRVSQTLAGWAIFDFENMMIRFVTNQQFLLKLCIVTFANSNSQVLFYIEVARSENLLRWLHNIEELGCIKILTYLTREPLMIIEPTGEKRVKIQQKVGCSFMDMNMATDGAKKDNLWIRNGYLLTKDGEIHTKGTFYYECDLLTSDTRE